ncbi:MAG: hypothetical protein RI897_4247 [Verrucomicrobiota bacterium]|jgi:octaheme c-type cytochrome (tetrathionate reductase family)
MRTTSIRIGVGLVLAVMGSVGLRAAQNHNNFISGTFTQGEDVTARCLVCHEEQATDFMATIHWTWSHTSGGQDLGKKTVINNYCVAVASNEPRCTSCHAGYGWRDDTFDFTDSSKIDCLVCHDATGTYKKVPTGAGAVDPTVDLLAVAKSVGSTPTRVACGSCHFYGGGGDAVKHGTMDSTLAAPTRAVDVHMGVDGLNFSCVVCHTADKHVMPGSRYSKDQPDNVNCEKCHTAAPHADPVQNTHAARVACQTCHIPVMARGNKGTKMDWNWETAGDRNPDGSTRVVKNAEGEEIYNSMKGSFVWERNVVPEYVWMNGGVTYVTGEDDITGMQLVSINKLQGNEADANSRIMPVKRFTGRQPYDVGAGKLAVPHLYPSAADDMAAYWKGYDWTTALTAGQESVGKTFIGPVGWVDTEMYWVQNHMVAPKEQALTCADCHTPRGRLDFAGLGYDADRALTLSTMAGFEIGEVDMVATPGQATLRWTGTPGNAYQVQAAVGGDLEQWENVVDGAREVPAGGAPAELSWQDTSGGGNRFYRITRTALP